MIIAGASLTAWAQEVAPGTVVSGAMKLTRVSIPLPPGNWEVVGASTSRNNNNRRFESYVLANFNGKFLETLIDVHTNVDLESEGFLANNECKRKDIHFSSGEQVNFRFQDCWHVNHLTMTLANNADKRWVDAYAKVRERTGTMPKTMIRTTWFKSEHGKMLNVAVYANPEARGFEPADGDWRTNPWHRDRVQDDPRMKAFVDEQIAFGREFRTRVTNGFSNR